MTTDHHPPLPHDHQLLNVHLLPFPLPSVCCLPFNKIFQTVLKDRNVWTNIRNRKAGRPGMLDFSDQWDQCTTGFSGKIRQYARRDMMMQIETWKLQERSGMLMINSTAAGVETCLQQVHQHTRPGQGNTLWTRGYLRGAFWSLNEKRKRPERVWNRRAKNSEITAGIVSTHYGNKRRRRRRGRDKEEQQKPYLEIRDGKYFHVISDTKVQIQEAWRNKINTHQTMPRYLVFKL